MERIVDPALHEAITDAENRPARDLPRLRSLAAQPLPWDQPSGPQPQ